jgi:hypothetical protein
VPKIVLRDEKTATDIRRLTVESTDGGIRISGWDLGDGVRAFHGGSEYEWTISVATKDLPALVEALGGKPGEDVFELMRRFDPNELESVILTKPGVPHEWWHWVSD